MPFDISRRKLLRAGAATGLASLSSLAGCTDRSGEDVTPSASETPTPSDSSPAIYESWLPAPSAMPDTERYYFFYNDYADITANQSALDADVYSAYADIQLFDSLGVSPDDVDYTVSRGAIRDPDSPAVVRGSFSESTVVETLETADFEPDGELGDYSIYRNVDVVAVDDGTVLYGRGDESVELFADADGGSVDRYIATDADLGAVFDRLGSGTFVYGATVERMTEADANPSSGQFAGEVALGYADTIAGATTTSEIVYAFADADSAASADIDAYTSGDIFDDFTRVSTSREGRVVVVTGEIPTAELYADQTETS